MDHVEGCAITEQASEAALAAAERAAAAADATLLFLGLNQTRERETHDRVSLALPGSQPALLRRVAAAAAAAGRPCILVVLSGGPVDLSFAKASEQVRAILWAGYGGEFGGEALAEVLHGQASPSGVLTQTWYAQHYAQQIRMSDMSFRPNASTGSPGRGHRYYTGTPVYAFGHGLSYASFRHAWARPPPRRFAAAAAPPFEVAVSVRHASGPSSAEALLLFLEPPPHLPGAPIHVLRGFEKLGPLRPGGSATARWELGAAAFALPREGSGEAGQEAGQEAGEAELVPGEWTVVVGALRHTVKVEP